MCRVASTPVMPGMFRSMTTTSGADSRTCCSASEPLDASATIVDALLLEQVAEAGAEEIVVVDQEHADRVRASVLDPSLSRPAALPSSARQALSLLVQGDDDRPSTPLERLRGRGEPDVDRVALDGAAGVGGDPVAVARDACRRVPSGITDGSTATTPGAVGIPVAVLPRIE